MRDQQCDVINYCACSGGIGKISVQNQIVIENRTKN